MSGLILGSDSISRCFWCGEKPDYVSYHDDEWGIPESDDYRLFEKICLEGFQSGLSWLTILRKRDNFRSAFCDFDFTRISNFSSRDVNRLMKDSGIVRHRGKIESVINNAHRAIEMVESEGSLSRWFWSFEPSSSERPKKLNHKTLMNMSQTDVSVRMSKELKHRGWSFVGPTTCYSFMQAMGLVNDHIEGCAFRERIESARTSFVRP